MTSRIRSSFLIKILPVLLVLFALLIPSVIAAGPNVGLGGGGIWGSSVGDIFKGVIEWLADTKVKLPAGDTRILVIIMIFVIFCSLIYAIARSFIPPFKDKYASAALVFSVAFALLLAIGSPVAWILDNAVGSVLLGTGTSLILLLVVIALILVSVVWIYSLAHKGLQKAHATRLSGQPEIFETQTKIAKAHAGSVEAQQESTRSQKEQTERTARHGTATTAFDTILAAGVPGNLAGKLIMVTEALQKAPDLNEAEQKSRLAALAARVPLGRELTVTLNKQNAAWAELLSIANGLFGIADSETQLIATLAARAGSLGKPIKAPAGGADLDLAKKEERNWQQIHKFAGELRQVLGEKKKLMTQWTAEVQKVWSDTDTFQQDMATLTTQLTQGDLAGALSAVSKLSDEQSRIKHLEDTFHRLAAAAGQQNTELAQLTTTALDARIGTDLES